MFFASWLQVVTIIHVVLVVFIIIAGFVKANPANLRPCAPFGGRGIFNEAAIVFFRWVCRRPSVN
jgi:APA family basic amino acid/polyamine antiporter